VITRFTVSLLMASALATSACAREVDSAEAETSDAQAETSADASSTANAAIVQPSSWDFPDTAWRDLDPENTMYIETDHGRIIIELAPQFAPNHVERVKTLANARFYDFLVWHRVIDGFMAQGGGAQSNPAHSTELPNINAEFSIRRNTSITISELQDRVINIRSNPQMAKAGFWNGFPSGTQTVALAGLTADGMVDSWLLHCTGAVSMARPQDPNGAGSQFYITRGNADHLNATYTVWGRVRQGQAAVDAIKIGTMGETLGFSPDLIRSIRVAADLPEEERTTIQVLDTNSTAFNSYLDTLRNEAGALPDVCEIDVPTRIVD
jgi:peptidylprolyl isomerase